MKNIIYVTEHAKYESMFDLLSEAWSIAGLLEDEGFGKKMQDAIQGIREEITAYGLEEEDK